MQRFKDGKGREWDVCVNVTTARKVKALTGVLIPGLIARGCSPLAELLDDPLTFVDVLFALCEDDAKARGVAAADFGAALYGGPLAEAQKAFTEELADFFPDPRVRAGLKEMFATGEKVADILTRQDREAAASLDLEKLATLVRSKLLRASTGSSGNSPASSESTPAPSPSGS
jgi:hypothetical protein